MTHLVTHDEVTPSARSAAQHEPVEHGREQQGFRVWQMQLAGWSALGLIHAALIVIFTAHVDLALLVGHVAYELGHLAALAGMSAAVAWCAAYSNVRLAERFGRWLARLLVAILLGAAACYVGVNALHEDLENFVAGREEAGSALPWLWIGVSSMNLGLAFVLLLSSYVARGRWAFVGLFAGAALALANNALLRQSYPGIHLYAASAAATCLGAGLLPLTTRWRLRLSRPQRALLLVCLGAGALTSLLVLPGPRLWRRLFDLPGSPLVAFVARWHASATPSAANGWLEPDQARNWYQPRTEHPALPASALKRPVAKPIVVLISIDALRAELLNRPQHLKQFPNLRALARRSLRFTNARSPSSATATSLLTLETGKYYSGTRWQAPNARRLEAGKSIWPSADPTPRLGELLTAAGVHTINVRTLNALSAETGLRRGYREEIDVGHYGSAAKATSVLVERLRAAGPEPLFLTTHLIEPHAPYRGGKSAGTPWERYLGEVRYVDKQLAKVLRLIRQTPELRSRTYVILTADHGEAFGEHGTRFHAATLYEELLRIPLLISGPGLRAADRDDAVSLIDLGPTVLDLYELPTPGHHLGQSLLPLLLGEDATLTRPLAAEAARRMQSLIFPDGVKVIVDLRKLTEEVYDLQHDPQENDNLAGTNVRARQAATDLRRFFDAHRLPNYEPPWRQF